jgi:hypothetical protein
MSNEIDVAARRCANGAALDVGKDFIDSSIRIRIEHR